MRRVDRQVTDIEQICEVIDRCKVLRLGIFTQDAPYIVPMNFGWERLGGAFVFYMHCAREGRKIDLLQKNARVGFEMDGAHALVDAQTACQMSYRYESIIGTGRIEFVEDALEKVHALEKIVLHQCGRRVKVDAAPEGVTVLLLRAESLECKRNARQGGLL